MNFVAESQFIYSGVKTFLENLRKPNAQFSYFPALSGVTENGKKLNFCVMRWVIFQIHR